MTDWRPLSLVKFSSTTFPGAAFGVAHVGQVHYCASTLGELLSGSAEGLVRRVSASLRRSPEDMVGTRSHAPVDDLTEVWAAGVTYERSREARIEESATADVYARVYEADRPELFLKAIGWRVVTSGEPIAIRRDSRLNVPEAELGLVINSAGTIVGFLVGNDVSSRSIEGENPLYLPQAKVYAASCALSGSIVLATEVERPTELDISCAIRRDGRLVWSAATSTRHLRRTYEHLVSALFAELDFPNGVVLLTGTGLVPPLDVTLESGDVVDIEISRLGRLTNPVVLGKDVRAAG